MHSGNGVSKAQLSVGVPSQLKKKLNLLARRQRRSLSSTVRVLLEEAIELEEALVPTNLQRLEYEIHLTTRQAAKMIKKGYHIQAWTPQYAQETLL